MAVSKGEAEEEILRYGDTTAQEGVPRFTSDGKLITSAVFSGTVNAEFSPYTSKSTNLISVGTTQTKLPATNLTDRRLIIISNIGSSTVWLGDSTVTAGNGLPLYPNSTFIIESGDSDDWYGIVSSGTCNVFVVEEK